MKIVPNTHPQNNKELAKFLNKHKQIFLQYLWHQQRQTIIDEFGLNDFISFFTYFEDDAFEVYNDCIILETNNDGFFIMEFSLYDMTESSFIVFKGVTIYVEI